MKIDFGIIALNAGDFIKHTIMGVYDIAHKIIIIEGAAVDSITGVCLSADKDGFSTDSTSEIIKSFPDPDNKIIYDRVGAVESKDDLSNRYLDYADCDYIWQLDADEVYESWVLEEVKEFLEKNPDVVCMDFIPWHFFKDFRHVGRGSVWDFPFRRLFKYVEGSVWKTHTPPTLLWPDSEKPVHERGRIVEYGFTKSRGWYLYHYSYVTERQVTEKLMYHGCRGYYRPNWVNRVWKNGFDEDVIKKYGSHPYDETRFHLNTRSKRGSVDLFMRKHPLVMKSHPLYKESYKKYKRNDILNVAHLIECWGAAGGCRCSYMVAKKMHELYGDTHEFIASIPGLYQEFSIKNAYMMNSSAKEVAHYINSKGFDLVAMEWWDKDKEKFKEIRRLVKDIPFIGVFHIYPIEGTEWDIRKKDIDWFDGFVVTGTKQLKLKQFSKYKDRMIYMNSPGDTSRYFNVERQPHSGFNVLLGGSYNDGKFRKNTFDILDKLTRMGDDVVIHLIGVVKSDGAYADLAHEKFANNERVHFIGFVDPAEYFRSMDLVLNILPDDSYALSECFIQEAMASGLPTIRLGGRGSEDIPENGIDGYFTYDEDEFFNMFKKIYSDEVLRKRMSEEATSTIELGYTPEKSAKVLKEFYLKILRGGK